MHDLLETCPAPEDWEPPNDIKQIRAKAAFLPEAEERVLLQIFEATEGGPPKTLPELGLGGTDFTDVDANDRKMLEDFPLAQDTIRTLLKYAKVGSMSAPRDHKAGDMIGGQAIVPMPAFLVYSKSKPDKPRLVTDLSRRSEKRFDLKRCIEEFPELEDWLRKLYAKNGGHISQNDLYARSDTTMSYMSLQDMCVRILFCFEETDFINSDFRAWYCQIARALKWRHIGLKSFAYRFEGIIYVVRSILHSLEMGDAPACWLGNTAHILLQKAVALSRPRSIFGARDALSARDYDLVPCVLKSVPNPSKIVNKEKLAHQRGIPTNEFRMNTTSHGHATFQDDALRAIRAALAKKALYEMEFFAMDFGLVHSEILICVRKALFVGILFDAEYKNIGFALEKWARIHALWDAFNRPTATGSVIAEWVGTLWSIVEIFPGLRAIPTQLAWWSGILASFAEQSRTSHNDSLRRSWKHLLTQIFQIPLEIRNLSKLFLELTFMKQAPAIDFVTDIVDTFQYRPMSPEQQAYWEGALATGNLVEITRVAALLWIVAYIFSIDSAPRGGACMFSHSHGPPLSAEDIKLNRKRRQPGDHCEIEWYDDVDFQSTFASSSTAVEIMGKTIMADHWWIEQATRQMSTRAHKLGAKVVVVFWGDNKGAVELIQDEGYNHSSFGPCMVLAEIKDKREIKLCSVHMPGKLIPADAPSRLSKPGWQKDLQKRKHFLGLDLDNRGRCVPPPVNWKKTLRRAIKIQRAYSRYSWRWIDREVVFHFLDFRISVSFFVFVRNYGSSGILADRLRSSWLKSLRVAQ